VLDPRGKARFRLLLGFVCLTLSACDLGDNGSTAGEGASDGSKTVRSVTTESTTTTVSDGPPSGEFTRAQLAAMMPPDKKAFDVRGRFWFDDSQFMSNRAVARVSRLLGFPRERTLGARKLAKAGRVSGYVGGYGNGYCGGACTKALLGVHTEVHVFRTAKNASRFIAAQSALHERFEGEELSENLTLTDVELFDPGDLGRNEVGIRAETLLREGESELIFRGTTILFRIGRLVALSDTGSLNQENPTGRAIILARKLDRRINAVLRE
jgi:hypothetical protein